MLKYFAGDPIREYQRESSSHRSYKDQSNFLKDLRFDTMKETCHKTFQSSFKYKSGMPDNFSTTNKMDYITITDGSFKLFFSSKFTSIAQVNVLMPLALIGQEMQVVSQKETWILVGFIRCSMMSAARFMLR
jgi:hypothetical protein